tara:strand:+ start:17243 stop:17425 length:183 start_codon:yes stop_codon:yes gene_type:complete
MSKIVRIEVAKNNGNFFFTGKLKEYDAENYIIDTIKGELLIFKKVQVQSIEVLKGGKSDK